MGKISRAAGRFGGPLLVDIAGLAGAGSLVYGAWLIYEPAGFIAGGCLLLAAAWLGARASAT